MNKSYPGVFWTCVGIFKIFGLRVNFFRDLLECDKLGIVLDAYS